MVYRYSWVAAALGVALGLARLNRLIRPSVEGIPWQIVLLGAVVLGAVVTWTALAYRLQTGLVIAINALAAALVSFRIVAPDTTWLFIPTWSTFESLGTELSYAGTIIRSGSAPVLASTGLVMVLTIGFWLLGAVAVYGLQRNRPFLAIVPPVGLYLYLATVDRIGLTWPWLLALLVVVAVGLAAVTLDERIAGTGRLSGVKAGLVGAIPGWSLVLVSAVAMVALLATAALGNAVPATGVVDWRYQTGLSGDFYGGVSYNPFINVQARLINPTNTPVFLAQTSGDIPADRLYWKMVTLDSFNGAWWFVDDTGLDVAEDGPFERRGFRFAGPTTEIIQDITMLGLRMEWLPAAYAPIAVESSEPQVDRGIRVTDDASLRFGSITFEGMNYRVRSDVPTPDLAALSVDDAGTPTAAFQQAIEDGVYDAPDVAEIDIRPEPADAERYLELPESVDPRVITLAETVTRGRDSPYERALALETFLRSPGNGFRYDTQVSPAGGTEDLAVWLLDTDHPDYRSGYCEQYALALGVLGRTVGLHTRVVIGFTPGEDIGDGRVVVRDRNAHAWVEIWMPSQGWVRFDATPRSDGVNPSAASALPFDIASYVEPVPIPDVEFEGGALPSPQLPIEEEFGRFLGVGGEGGQTTPVRLPGWLTSFLPYAIIGGLAVAALPLYKTLRRRRRMRRLRQGDVTAAWEEIVSRLTDLGERPAPSQTPHEYATSTQATLVPLADVYAEAVYGPERPGEAGLGEAASVTLRDAEQELNSRFGPGHRLASRYRLKSVWRRGSRRGRSPR